MICPSCKNEVKPNAKFCTRCGLNLAAMAAVEVKKESPAPLCKTCGAQLKQGAKFCVKCGTPIEAAPQIIHSQETVVLEQPVSTLEEAVISPISVQKEQTVMKVEEELPTPEVKEVQTVMEAEEELPTPEVKEVQTVVEAKEEPSAPLCKTCGAQLKQGAKFCVNCGTPAGEEPKAIENVHLKEPKPAKKVKPEEPKTAEQSKAPVSTPKPKAPRSQKKKKSSSTIIVLLLILIVLIAGAGTVGVLMWQGIIPVPDLSADTSLLDGEESDVSSIEESTEGGTEISELADEIDMDELFADIDALAEEAKGKIGEDAEIINAMDGLSSAVNDYVARAEEAGDAALAADRVEDAYEAYIEAVEKHKDMMNASTLSGAIYAQIMSELDAAEELGNELVDKGYEIDLSSLKTSRDEFDSSYRERIIDTFDEFTTREAWSRTEAWNLMKDTDSMYDSADLDDPIRLRYVYALAWWTQKQIETELASGTITEKGAAIKIAGLIEAMDYNPMMVDYYIQYMKAAREDCSTVETAYNEVIEHIKDTQGIEIGKDIDLAHFWYYNDISNPADGVLDGTVNGVTQENREWIRNRMEYAGFVNQ